MKKAFVAAKMAALLLVLGAALAFAGCSNSSSSPALTPVVAHTNPSGSSNELPVEFVGTLYGQETILHFDADKTYYISWAGFKKYRGTWTLTSGDFTNGSGVLHQTHKYKNDQWIEAVEDEPNTIVNGTFKAMGSTFTKK